MTTIAASAERIWKGGPQAQSGDQGSCG